MGFIINLFMVNPEINFSPGGSVFLSFQAKKTNRTSFIKYIIKKPNKAGGRKMGFSKMLELLQEKNKGYIILANAEAFYLARGKMQ